MNVITPGHVYDVDFYEPGGSFHHSTRFLISFFKKVGENFPFNEEPQHTGTNCQELLRVLIDRVKFLQKQAEAMGDTESVDDDEEILWHLRFTLMHFENRAARRKNVDWKKEKTELWIVDPETVLPCSICGHIFPHSHIGDK